MGMAVAVAGASGYAGGELLRLIAGHPDLELTVITGSRSAGQTVGELHPNLAGLPGLAERVFEPHETNDLLACDLVFLCLPAGQSAAVAAGLPDLVKVVDLGPDFRLGDRAAWGRHYDGPHHGRWVTGLPELPGARPLIRAANRVAAPGCYATAVILALAPLVAAGLADARDVVVVAASGTSGAGRTARADLLGSEVMGSVSAYQAGGVHRHTPEIEQALGDIVADGSSAMSGGAAASAGGAAGADVRVSFTPLLTPMPRGILATCTIPLAPATVSTAGGSGGSSTRASTADLRSALAASYAGEPFVCLLPEGRWPATAAVAGSNAAHLQAAADPRTGRATVIVAIDNLGKGAAGQAMQNANLMLGLAETAGLTSIGVAP